MWPHFFKRYSQALFATIPQIYTSSISSTVHWYLPDATSSLESTDVVHLPRELILRVHGPKDSHVQVVPLQQPVSVLVNRLVRMHVMDMVPRV